MHVITTDEKRRHEFEREWGDIGDCGGRKEKGVML